MQDMIELETYFINDIKRQSETEAEKLKKEQDAIRTKAIAEIHAETEKEGKVVLEQELKEMRSEYTVKNSKIKEEKNRKLMLKREELTSQIFEEVEAKLHKYVQSKDYLENLIKQIEDLKITDQDVVFYIGKQDEPYEKTLFGKYPHANVKVDSHILIGGFRMENEQAGLVVDNTLDANLDDEKRWFYANSSLAIR